MKRAAILAVSFLMSAAVTGCGGSTGGATHTGVAPSSPTTPSLPTASLPAGWQAVKDTRAGISFGLPGTWTVLAGGSQTTQSILKLGMSRLHLTISPEVLRQLDLMAFKPRINGAHGNIDAGLTPLFAIPSPAALKVELSALKMQFDSSRTVTTPIGQALAIYYTLPQVHDHGAGLYAVTPKGIVSIAVTDPSADNARQLLAQVIGSLRLIH